MIGVAFIFTALVYLSLLQPGGAFTLHRQPSFVSVRHETRGSIILYSSYGASCEKTSHHTKTSDVDTSGLRFKAYTTYRSKNAPLPQSPEQQNALSTFFSTDKDNFHLLAKGTRNNIQDASKQMSPAHLERWTEEARRMGADEPSSGDTLLSLSVTTPFLVFVLKVTAMIGVKLLWNSFEAPDSIDHKILLPEYQFVLLDQSFSADGPPPLVFIFNQLTGIKKKVQGTYTQPNHALFTVKAEPSEDKKRLSFISRMTAELNIRFPQILLKLLPVPKERIENEGSASLKKSMQRDVPPGVDLFRNAYVDWLARVEK